MCVLNKRQYAFENPWLIILVLQLNGNVQNVPYATEMTLVSLGSHKSALRCKIQCSLKNRTDDLHV